VKTYGELRLNSTILDLGTGWWVAFFTSLPLFRRGIIARYPLCRRLGGPQSLSGRRGEERNLLLPPFEEERGAGVERLLEIWCRGWERVGRYLISSSVLRLRLYTSVSQPLFERGTLFFVVSPRGTLTYEATTAGDSGLHAQLVPSAIVISSCLWSRRTSVRPHTSPKIWWTITS
jgi:hypothetical protein